MAARKGLSKQSKGKRHRKHGRWLRAPAMRRYVVENRWETNKRKRAERHDERAVLCKAEAERTI